MFTWSAIITLLVFFVGFGSGIFFCVVSDGLVDRIFARKRKKE